MGNVCNASPAADGAPVLLTLDAEVELASRDRGTRRLPLAGFVTGNRATTRAADELVTGLFVAGSGARARARGPLDLPEARCAGLPRDLHRDGRGASWSAMHVAASRRPGWRLGPAPRSRSACRRWRPSSKDGWPSPGSGQWCARSTLPSSRRSTTSGRRRPIGGRRPGSSCPRPRGTRGRAGAGRRDGVDQPHGQRRARRGRGRPHASPRPTSFATTSA